MLPRTPRLIRLGSGLWTLTWSNESVDKPRSRGYGLRRGTETRTHCPRQWRATPLGRAQHLFCTATEKNWTSSGAEVSAERDARQDAEVQRLGEQRDAARRELQRVKRVLRILLTDFAADENGADQGGVPVDAPNSRTST